MLLVGLFAFAYTGLDLLQPLVYRNAINDFAGLFVAQGSATAHGGGMVAARTPAQTFRTLLESVVLLFAIAVGSSFVYQKSDYYGARVASHMESKLIVDTFGHVLRLPLRFFEREASAGLAKRIDQCDQLAPVVHAFSQQIAPEALRLVGICAIMRTQNYEKDGFEARWRGIYDDKGRLMVAICHNMDLGDSWEHADEPAYDEKFSSLGFKIAVNYITYSMTH